MAFLLEQMRLGGPLMYLLIAEVVFAGMLWVVRLGLSVKTGFPGLGVATTSGLVATGLVGTSQGLIQTFEVVAHASTETKLILLERGVELSMITVWWGLALGALLLVLHGAVWLREPKPVRSGLLTVCQVCSTGVAVLVGLAGAALFRVVEGIDSLYGELIITIEVTTRIFELLTASVWLGLLAFGLSGIAGSMSVVAGVTGIRRSA